jgi:hypothetical protein
MAKKRASAGRSTSRQSGRGSQNNPSKVKPSNWLSLEDAFQRLRDRLGSSEDAKDELNALLRSRPSAKRQVSASGEETPSFVDTEFWQNEATLSVVIDADGVDHIAVHYTDYSLSDGHAEFFVRTADIERAERLYPTIAASLPVPGKERKPAPKKKRRKAKQASGAGAPEQHDWEEGELFVMRELKTRGNPLDKKHQTKGWKTISDVAKLARGHLQKHSEDGVGPDMSTTRGKVSGWIKKFERERN